MDTNKRLVKLLAEMIKNYDKGMEYDPKFQKCTTELYYKYSIVELADILYYSGAIDDDYFDEILVKYNK